MRKIKCFLVWINESGGMAQFNSVKTVRECRDFIYYYSQLAKNKHVFGQIVYFDDSRKDIFAPKKIKGEK